MKARYWHEQIKQECGVLDTPSQKAKQLGAKSLKSVAEVFGCTVQNLNYQYKTNPEKFEVIVLGAIKVLERNNKDKQEGQ